jgi:2-C-methyl-D-erythritol 4-phosphate cytidylyltransferase
MAGKASEQVHLVIVAAGTGNRYRRSTPGQQQQLSQLPKQYNLIGNKTVLSHTIEAFAGIALAGITVVLHPKDQHWQDLPPRPDQLPVQVTRGGEQRHDSVRNGIRALQADPADWVLVHDAARPCVSQREINDLILACQQQQKGGLLVRPVTDTIKHSTDGRRVNRTLNRDQLFAALTPQMFRCGELLKALTVFEAGSITDEASAMEAQGQQPLMVTGSRHNLKITEYEDLALAESILRQQGRLS